jgi:hypothetical protein
MVKRILFIWQYIRYTFYFTIFTLMVYAISRLSGNLRFEIFDYQIYSTQKAFISGILLFICFFVVFLFYLLRLFLTINKMAKFLLFKLKHFNQNQKKFLKTEKEIITEIMLHKKNKQYKDGLACTGKYLYFNSKCFYWHLYFLLKNKKYKDFLVLFKSKPSSRFLKFFTLFYIPKKVFFKERFLQNLYIQNPNSDAFGYLYAKFLFLKKKLSLSRAVLVFFTDRGSFLIQDPKYGFLINSLMIEVETALNGNVSEGCLFNYIENIEFYNDKQKTKSIY